MNMDLGSFFDYAIDWNKANGYENKEENIRREATQYDWNVLFS